MSVTVRRAELRDFAEVRRLSIGFTASAAQVPEEEVRARFARMLADPCAFLAVAEVDADDAAPTRLAGYVSARDFEPGLRSAFTTGRIDDLYVDPQARRHGVGRALVDAAFAWARSNPLPMILDWQSSPSAVEFYERLGFEADREGDYAEYPAFTLDLREEARQDAGG